LSVRAVVFAYHDVGDRCLRALVSRRWDVPLVVTHEADPREAPWFASVAETAKELDIPVLMPATADQSGLTRTVSQLKPDFIFSFYYRNLLGQPLLQTARRGALNVHGSLLPRFRGRAPVNWAILRGERQTGATLHHMIQRADAGDIVDQLAVPILIDDDARQVMEKVALAAETVLARNLGALADGTAPRHPQDLSQGEYCGRRTPEDGRIDWRASAVSIHNLVRAVAPPFPGAFTDVNDKRWWLHRTRLMPGRAVGAGAPRLYGEDGRCFIACADGTVLELLGAATAEGTVDLRTLADQLAQKPMPLR
jgi:methionyl-tRNA formyltransferase